MRTPQRARAIASRVGLRTGLPEWKRARGEQKLAPPETILGAHESDTALFSLSLDPQSSRQKSEFAGVELTLSRRV